MYEKFEKLLKEHGETAHHVAKETGIPKSTFTSWKAGKYKPKVEKLQKIAKHFGVPVTFFLEQDNEEIVQTKGQ